MPAPWEVRSMPSGLSCSITLLKPKSVIFASKHWKPEPSKMFPEISTHKVRSASCNMVKYHYLHKLPTQTKKTPTRLEVKVYHRWLDLVEILERQHTLKYDSSCLGTSTRHWETQQVKETQHLTSFSGRDLLCLSRKSKS